LTSAAKAGLLAATAAPQKRPQRKNTFFDCAGDIRFANAAKKSACSVRNDGL